MSRKPGWVAFLTLALVPVHAWAADITFDVTVDKTRLGMQDYLSLTLTISGANIKGVSPVLPDLKGFSVLSGPSTSTQTSWSFVNGQQSQSETCSHTYVLRPLFTGTFTIGPFSLRHGGKQYTSNAVVAEVVPGSTAQARPAPGTIQGAQPAEGLNLDGNLFLEAKADKNRAYVGEQIVLTYKLYSRVEITGVESQSTPDFTGFWCESLYDAQQIRYGREVVGGQEFRVLHLKTVALFPTTPGGYDIDPLEVVCRVKTPSRRRSFFGFDESFFFGGGRQVVVASKPLSITVLPLPGGAPPGFGGAVGSFSISGRVDATEVKEGDPVSVTVSVSGTGNLRNVTQLKPPDLSDFKVYDPQITSHAQNTLTTTKGTKEFKYVMIPKAKGVLQIGPFAFSYLDADSGEYKSLQTRPVSITVSPRPADEQPQPPLAYGLAQKDIEELGSDIRYIKPDLSRLHDQRRALYQSNTFLLLQLVPVLSLLGAVMFKRHRERIQTDPAYVRRKKSKGEAVGRLRRAKKYLSDGQASGTFYAEVYKALSGFLGDRLNVPSAGMTGESASLLLADRGLDPGVITQVRDAFEQCDFARFSLSSLSSEDRQRLFDLTQHTIEQLEKQI